MAIPKSVLPGEPVEAACSSYQHAVALLGDETAAGEIANGRLVDWRVLEGGYNGRRFPMIPPDFGELLRLAVFSYARRRTIGLILYGRPKRSARRAR